MMNAPESPGPTPEPDHQVFLLVCFGGMSNTGYLTGLAAMEAVKRVGLRKAGIACLAGVPSETPSVMGRLKKARAIVTVDGCPTQCASKIATAAGLPVARSITLADDCQITKVSFRAHLDLKDPLDLIPREDLEKATAAIVSAVNELSAPFEAAEVGSTP